MIKQTTVQVSVGMRPSCSTKSTGVSMCGAKPCLERDPLRHITVERSSEKERWHLSQPITLLYGCSRLASFVNHPALRAQGNAGIENTAIRASRA